MQMLLYLRHASLLPYSHKKLKWCFLIYYDMGNNTLGRSIWAKKKELHIIGQYEDLHSIRATWMHCILSMQLLFKEKDTNVLYKYWWLCLDNTFFKYPKFCYSFIFNHCSMKWQLNHPLYYYESYFSNTKYFKVLEVC